MFISVKLSRVDDWLLCGLSDMLVSQLVLVSSIFVSAVTTTPAISTLNDVEALLIRILLRLLESLSVFPSLISPFKDANERFDALRFIIGNLSLMDFCLSLRDKIIMGESPASTAKRLLSSLAVV